MVRRLLNLLTALSLLLCVTVSVMWVRSYFRYDGLYLTKVVGPDERPERRFFHARSSLGSVSLCSTYQNCVRDFMNPYDRKLMGAGWVRTVRVESPPASIAVGGGWLGFQSKFESDVHEAQTRYDRVVVLPYWLFATVLAITPVLWLRAWRHRRRRLVQSLCPVCGYDLRATPERCPECGARAVGGR